MYKDALKNISDEDLIKILQADLLSEVKIDLLFLGALSLEILKRMNDRKPLLAKEVVLNAESNPCLKSPNDRYYPDDDWGNPLTP